MRSRGRCAYLVAAIALFSVFGASASASSARSGEAHASGQIWMVYPIPDYGNPDGGVKWQYWVKPKHWTDEDTVSVSHADWRHWGSSKATARVHVTIAAERGRATVTLSNRGFCAAINRTVYLTETDRGGPWGAVGTSTSTEQCQAAQSGAASSRAIHPASANDSASCGAIRSDALPAGEGHAFTYKYQHCRRARRILTAYLRKIGDVAGCEPFGCARKVRGWKCHTPQVHGTLVGCVPKGKPWSGENRPFVGISSP